MSLYLKNGIRLPTVSYIVYLVADQWDGKRVFLQDGDALVYPYDKLVEALQYLSEKFPRLERVSTYATPQDILRRSQQELKTLQELKLSLFYTGVESGDDEVLSNVNKGVSHRQLIEAGQKVKQAGITFSVTVILGLGGIEGSKQHVLETARILSDLISIFSKASTSSLCS